jgi:predicted nucleic acid-binding protein
VAGRRRRFSTTSAAIVSDVYVDTSAFVKLVLDERESDDLASYIRALPRPPVSSAILRVEAMRTVRLAAADPTAIVAMRVALAGLYLVGLHPSLFREAETIEPAALRTLDALHLVTALDLGAREMIVYDVRLADAAAAHGLITSSPGA